jgi:hypothetical protein
LRTIAANLGQESDPFGSVLSEISRRNAEAIVRSATGQDLDADLTVTAGHEHDDIASAILWHQLGSWQFAEDSDNGGREGRLVTATALADVALIPLRFPALDGWAKRFFVRFRLSNPAPTYVTYTILRLFGQLLDLGGVPKTRFLFDVSIQSSAAKTYSEAWLTYGPFVFADGATPGNWWLQLQAAITTIGDKATLWELQVGYL